MVLLWLIFKPRLRARAVAGFKNDLMPSKFHLDEIYSSSGQKKNPSIRNTTFVQTKKKFIKAKIIFVQSKNNFVQTKIIFIKGKNKSCPKELFKRICPCSYLPLHFTKGSRNDRDWLCQRLKTKTLSCSADDDRSSYYV
jgi:hypothetical protein